MYSVVQLSMSQNSSSSCESFGVSPNLLSVFAFGYIFYDLFVQLSLLAITFTAHLSQTVLTPSQGMLGQTHRSYSLHLSRKSHQAESNHNQKSKRCSSRASALGDRK